MPSPFPAIDRLLQAQQWNEAVRAIDALPGAATDVPALQRRRRMALAMAGRLVEALESAQRVVAGPEAEPADLQHLAHILLRTGRHGEAFDAAAAAIRAAPSPVRPHAIAIAAAVLEPDVAPRLVALLGPPPTDEGHAPRPCRARTVAVPWRLPVYRPYSGPHPVITSTLGRGCRFEPRWATAATPAQPARALPMLPALTAWAARLDAAGRAALAEFLVHRLPFCFHAVPAADLTFHHTVPFALPGAAGNRPWVLHLEHLNMLFAPMITYPTAVVRPDDPQVALVRDLLADDACLGVFTHIRETKALVDRLFDDPRIRVKTVYRRFGFDLEPTRRRPKAPAVRRTVTSLLFTNSLARDNFFIRGGPDVLGAFVDLHRRHGGIRLVMRSATPEFGAEELIRRTRRHPAIAWLTEPLSDAEIDTLYEEADLFLLPSGLLHAVSLVRALRAGLGVVASDVFGVSEFLRNRVNGLVVPGRRASVTPRVEGAVFAEDSRRLLHPSSEPPEPLFHARFRAAVDLLLRNPHLQAALRRNARFGAARDHAGERWAADVSTYVEERWAARPLSLR
ncbi:MAG TPA: glycosyltransferase [Azospirillum sp.]